MTENRYFVLNGQKEGLPAVIVVDRLGLDPATRGSHVWHLSVIMDCKDLAEQGMPTKAEYLVLDQLGDRIEAMVRDTGHGAFLARITWNRTRQLLFRVSEPDLVADALGSEIARDRSERSWDFKMWKDPEWKDAEWYSNAIKAG
jgi:hypothetical protein